MPDAGAGFAATVPGMEGDAEAVRFALIRAGESLEIAQARVRAAQDVRWESVFAERYRSELFEASRSMRALAWELESLREAS